MSNNSMQYSGSKVAIYTMSQLLLHPEMGKNRKSDDCISRTIAFPDPYLSWMYKYLASKGLQDDANAVICFELPFSLHLEINYKGKREAEVLLRGKAMKDFSTPFEVLHKWEDRQYVVLFGSTYEQLEIGLSDTVALLCRESHLSCRHS